MALSSVPRPTFQPHVQLDGAWRQPLPSLASLTPHLRGAGAAQPSRRRFAATAAAGSASNNGNGTVNGNGIVTLSMDGGAEEDLSDTPAASNLTLDQEQLELAVQKAVERLTGLSGGSTQLAPEQHPQTVDQSALSQTIQRVVKEEVRAVLEREMQEQAAHANFEQEAGSGGKQAGTLGVAAAVLKEGVMKFDLTANVNTVMAITAVISYWRGVGGLLDILFEDSLEGYVACVAFGWLVILLIRTLKLPVVEGNGLGF